MLVVCDNIKKDEYLNNFKQNKLTNIKFMSKQEFINKFYYETDNKTNYYVMREFDCNYEIAKIYIKNTYYVDFKNYNNNKLDKLVSVKKYIFDNDLVKIDRLFKEYLKSVKVVFDSLNLSLFDKEMIESVKDITSVEVIDKEYQTYEHNIYCFKTIDEEVEYVAICICDLIAKGVITKNIKITNINSDYDNSINRIFKMYNLRVKEDVNLYGTEVVSSFINNYDSDIKNTINLLVEKKYDQEIIDKIVDVCNKYNFVKDYKLVKDLIIYDLKKLKFTKHYDNEIEIIDLYNNNIKDEYVFMLNYNLESIPKVYVDKDYITDDIKDLVNLEKTEVLNKQERIKAINAINDIKNLIITYKLKTPFASFSRSNLFDVEDSKVEFEYKNYSNISNKINLTKMLDNLVKFKEKDPKLDLYYKHFTVDYNTFDNTYKTIDKNTLNNHLKDKFNLSYTSMNDYYKCSFKYYLKYILKLDKKSDEFKRHIGSIFHYVLEKGLKDNISIIDTVYEYIHDNNIELSNKNKFFLNNLVKELPFLIDVIKKQDKLISLNERLYEESIVVKFDDVNFKGIIDKVIYENGYYALIDYKTGSSSIDLRLNYYGINMQLAIYLYLASKKFTDAKFTGFYLQHILSSSLKDDLDTKENNLKLCGYSNKDYIKYFDKTYQDSKLIKSLKMKANLDYYSYSKVLSDKQVNNLIKLSDNKIKECIEGVKQSQFTINPKSIDGKNIGCEFCIYKDICFMNNKNIINLEMPDLEYLDDYE